ncbi:hypothetical protein BDZ97DRAFT_2054557 [Flammula alnicola]|nr:hypothetical protein BDZ97DRAFT_1769210 [Flammula alnicola]KAF8971857.1 hypothetical protein BDZ97DRAFT_2054557 [Flammula alnicola]
MSDDYDNHPLDFPVSDGEENIFLHRKPCPLPNEMIHELAQCQCICKIPRVLDLYPQIVLMPVILLRKVGCMLKVTRLSAHTNRGDKVERQLLRVSSICLGIPPRFCLDEAVEPHNVFELGVGVEQEGGVVGVG